MASGASGAELANIVNEAALSAVRAGRSFVTQADMEESIEACNCRLPEKECNTYRQGEACRFIP